MRALSDLLVLSAELTSSLCHVFLYGRARRQTKFWKAEEESFLRRGVAKHGMGKWKVILMEGRGVFSSHRTNIDLKVRLCRCDQSIYWA